MENIAEDVFRLFVTREVGTMTSDCNVIPAVLALIAINISRKSDMVVGGHRLWDLVSPKVFVTRFNGLFGVGHHHQLTCPLSKLPAYFGSPTLLIILIFFLFLTLNILAVPPEVAARSYHAYQSSHLKAALSASARAQLPPAQVVIGFLESHYSEHDKGDYLFFITLFYYYLII